MSDIQTVIYEQSVNHAPLLLGIAVLGWKGLPRILRAFFTNGGGEIIRKIVEDENLKQSVIHEERFRKHEQDQERRFREIEDKLPRRRR